MPKNNYSTLLQSGAKSLGLNLTELQIKQLLQYLDLLRQWNKVHNLCAAASYEHMLAYHILDSLSVAANLKLANQQILDVGTGAGLPGVPLAIAVPSCQITLLDAKEKKISFIQHAINALQLTNITAINSRIENYQPLSKFNLVISRAFASLEEFIKLSARLCLAEGKLIAMKSNSKDFSLNTVVTDDYQIVEIKQLMVPGIASERCLVVVNQLLAN